MSPTFSVMTPVYNGAAFIDRCYFMLCRQTFTDWEWVVVNDGSTDETERRVRAIDDPRIRLISYRQNRGRGHARNEALQAARGEWLAVWDVDDVYFPDRIEKANQARLAGYDFCCSYALLIDNDLRITGVRGFTRDDSGTTPMFVHPSLSFRLELAREIGYNPVLPAGEDAGLILYLARKCNGLWLKDTVTAYQQVSDVHVRKSISSNYARLVSYRTLYKTGILDIGAARYVRMIIKLNCRLAMLNLCRLWPSMYLKSVAMRSSGVIDDGWQLSAERKAFLEVIRQGHWDGNWSGADSSHQANAWRRTA